MNRTTTRKCKTCRQAFEPRLPMQSVCSLECAQSLAPSLRAKAEKRQAVKEKREDRARKERLKTRSDYIKEAQREFNRYIRARDCNLPCICCGEQLGTGEVGGAFDCGHYRSVGSAPHLRFDEDNAHGQRKRCNRYGSGRAVDYRIGLIERIGIERVDRLEADQAPKHYSIDDLQAIKKLYAAKTRQLLKEKE